MSTGELETRQPGGGAWTVLHVSMSALRIALSPGGISAALSTIEAKNTPSSDCTSHTAPRVDLSCTTSSALSKTVFN